MENGSYFPFLVDFFFSFFFFYSFTFRRRSWRIKLYEWHSQRGPRGLLSESPALFSPRYSTRRLQFPISGTVSRSERMNEVEKDGDVRIRKLKAFSCVSDPRCERSSPAALSCSLRCRSGRAYDSSCSLEQTMKKTCLYITEVTGSSRNSRVESKELVRVTFIISNIKSINSRITRPTNFIIHS